MGRKIDAVIAFFGRNVLGWTPLQVEKRRLNRQKLETERHIEDTAAEIESLSANKDDLVIQVHHKANGGPKHNHAVRRLLRQIKRLTRRLDFLGVKDAVLDRKLTRVEELTNAIDLHDVGSPVEASEKLEGLAKNIEGVLDAIIVDADNAIERAKSLKEIVSDDERSMNDLMEEITGEREKTAKPSEKETPEMVRIPAHVPPEDPRVEAGIAEVREAITSSGTQPPKEKEKDMVEDEE